MLVPSIFGESLLDDFMSFPEMSYFDDMERRLYSGTPYGRKNSPVMKTDIHEQENGYQVDIELPGYKKDEINLSLDNGYLVVGASKNVSEDQKNEKGKVIRMERYSGSMQRSFYVGDAINEEDIKAKFEDGILKLSIPKKEEKKVEEKKTIMIEG